MEEEPRMFPPGGTRTVEWWGRWLHTGPDGQVTHVEYLFGPDSEIDDRTRRLISVKDRAYYERKLAHTEGDDRYPGRGELLWREIVTWPGIPDGVHEHGLPGGRYVGPWNSLDDGEPE